MSVYTSSSLETQLFSSEDWDEGGDSGDMLFFKVKLKVDLDESFPKGHEFAYCNFLASKSVVEFFDSLEDESGYVYELKLSANRKH